MVDVDDPRDAQQGVRERAGRIRADVETRCVARCALAPTGPEGFVYTPRPLSLGVLGEVTDLGGGFARVSRRASSR